MSIFNTSYIENDILNVDNTIIHESRSELIGCLMLEFLSKDQLNYFLNNRDEKIKSLDTLTERTIVQLDKEAEMTQCKKKAMLQIAKEKDDPEFKKWILAIKLRNKMEAILFQRYGAEAESKTCKAIAAALDSDSETVKDAGMAAKGLTNSDRVNKTEETKDNIN